MKKIIIVTGAGGLIGGSACKEFAESATIIGVENNQRAKFFGEEASTKNNLDSLKQRLGKKLHIEPVDIRNRSAIAQVFHTAKSLGKIEAIIHTAAQPSHDWPAKRDNGPHIDFEVNGLGTLNLLEETRLQCPEAAFVFTSTNKVYGDTPNRLPLDELANRWEIKPEHPYASQGIDESMSIDQTKHSLFGVSKASADLLVQEYGRYFSIPTVCFRGGCLTGPSHAGTELHGFLAYLMKCTTSGIPYRIFGYKGKQVRDNIHSQDLISAFKCFIESPKTAAVYNIGGGRHSNCSMQEAISLCEEISGKKLRTIYEEKNREGDHIWWISNTTKFQGDYPTWNQMYNIRETLEEIHKAQTPQ
jgi:CDP-paratose 2-epimerase